MNEYNENYNEHERNHNQYNSNKYDCFHHKHPFLSHLMTALAMLLGAYLAFYVVSDWHFKRMLDPIHQMKRVERMMMKEDRALQKFAQREINTERNIESYIKLDETPNAYIVTVNLKPFDNDEDNVSISTDDNTLTVHANGEKKQRNGMKALAISQSYEFPQKVDFNKISKKVNGDKYLITIPIK